MPSDHFPFTRRERVRYGETDMQGVVYYANYLLYAEIGRFAYLRELGVPHAALMDAGTDFTIADARVRYIESLRFEDEYDVRMRVERIGRTSWAFAFAIDRADGVRCAEGQTVQVTLDRATSRPTPLPTELRAALERAIEAAT